MNLILQEGLLGYLVTGEAHFDLDFLLIHGKTFLMRGLEKMKCLSEKQKFIDFRSCRCSTQMGLSTNIVMLPKKIKKKSNLKYRWEIG